MRQFALRILQRQFVTNIFSLSIQYGSTSERESVAGHQRRNITRSESMAFHLDEDLSVHTLLGIISNLITIQVRYHSQYTCTPILDDIFHLKSYHKTKSCNCASSEYLTFLFRIVSSTIQNLENMIMLCSF